MTVTGGAAADLGHCRFTAAKAACTAQNCGDNCSDVPAAGTGNDLGLCPWRSSSGSDTWMRCLDGSYCDTEGAGSWGCCNQRGGRAQCPASHPHMCALRACGGNDDHCCMRDCTTIPPRLKTDDDGNGCSRPITTLAECSAAAVALQLSDSAVNDPMDYYNQYYPPWCYYSEYRGQVRFNSNGMHGRCNEWDQCLCKLPDIGVTPLPCRSHRPTATCDLSFTESLACHWRVADPKAMPLAATRPKRRLGGRFRRRPAVPRAQKSRPPPHQPTTRGIPPIGHTAAKNPARGSRADVRRACGVLPGPQRQHPNKRGLEVCGASRAGL